MERKRRQVQGHDALCDRKRQGADAAVRRQKQCGRQGRFLHILRL